MPLPLPTRFAHLIAKPFLLAFLTQTSRFHDGLIAQIPKRTGLQTAEYYASAARLEMGPSFTSKIWSLARACEEALHGIQALLMLGFHEYNMWGQEAGWLNINSALNLVHALQYVDDEKREEKQNHGRREEKQNHGKHDPPVTDDLWASNRFVDREIERRTVWCCFILDRYLCADRDYPGWMQGKRLGRKLQLPCSDKAFNNGRSRRTRKLRENDEQYAARRRYLREKAQRSQDLSSTSYEESEWEVGEQEGELSLYLQIVDVYGDIIQWSCDDGRRKEIHPPWHPESEFKPLESRLNELQRQLPRDFQLTPLNTRNHYYSNTPRHYVSIHSLHMLSTVALYREYMAFTPWELEEPAGPLDEPRIEEEPPEPDYWRKQAEKCFGSAREFAELLKACPRQTKEQHEIVVETPMICFSIYQIAWFSAYCQFFSKMDPGNSLEPDSKMWDFTNTLIKSTFSRWKKPRDWGYVLRHVQGFLNREKANYKEARGSPNSTASDSGGGLPAFVVDFERNQKDFGTIAYDRRLESGEKLKKEENSSSPPAQYKKEVNFPVSFVASTPDPSGAFTSINKSRTSTPVNHRALDVPQVYASASGALQGQANGNPPFPPYNHPSTAFPYTTSYGQAATGNRFPMDSDETTNMNTTHFNSSSDWPAHQSRPEDPQRLEHFVEERRSAIPPQFWELNAGPYNASMFNDQFTQGYLDDDYWNAETEITQNGLSVSHEQHIYSPVQDQQSYPQYLQYSNN